MMTGTTYNGTARSIPKAIIFTILTLGIYGVYWLYSVARDLSQAKPDSGISPGRDLLLDIVTLGIYYVYSMYKYPRVIVEIQRERGLPVHDFAVISLVLTLVGLGIIPWCMIQSELNKIWESGRAKPIG